MIILLTIIVLQYILGWILFINSNRDVMRKQAYRLDYLIALLVYVPVCVVIGIIFVWYWLTESNE